MWRGTWGAKRPPYQFFFYNFYKHTNQPGAQLGRGGGRTPLPFWKIGKKYPDFGKINPNSVYTWAESYIQNVVLRVFLGEKTPKFCEKFDEKF